MDNQTLAIMIFLLIGFFSLVGVLATLAFLVKIFTLPTKEKENQYD